MTDSEAQVLATEALELGQEGRWQELMALPLSAQALEIVRRKTSLDKQITNLESQETVLYQLLLKTLEVEP